MLDKLNLVLIGARTMFLDMGRKKEGQGLVEYALILGLVVLVVFGALVLFGHSVHNSLNNTANTVSHP